MRGYNFTDTVPWFRYARFFHGFKIKTVSKTDEKRTVATVKELNFIARPFISRKLGHNRGIYCLLPPLGNSAQD
jgi:hypothetical protein